jgi:two-component system sensor histidine kinase AgrC
MILTIYGENVKLKYKLWFSALCGITLETVLIYTLFFINESKSFSEINYLFITMLNPFFALIFYFFALKLLRLSGLCSFHLTADIYISLLSVKMLGRFTSSFLFPQNQPMYNYFLDVLAIVMTLMIYLIIYFLTVTFIKKRKFIVRLPKDTKARLSAKKIINTISLVCGSYMASVLVPVILDYNPLAYLLLAVVFALIFLVAILANAELATVSSLAEKDYYISSLSSANDKFKLVKHDFYNILGTYSGYIQVGDIDKLKKYHEKLLSTTLEAGDHLDLNRRMDENPALISLIINKLKQARKANIFMRVNLLCSVEESHMDNLVMCRAMACMLDNALEAAAESAERRVSLLFERTRSGSRRILLTNSVRGPVEIDKIGQLGFTTKEGHSGLGFAEAQWIFEKSGGIFNASCGGGEFTVYIETPYNSKLQPAGNSSLYNP